MKALPNKLSPFNKLTMLLLVPDLWWLICFCNKPTIKESNNNQDHSNNKTDLNNKCNNKTNPNNNNNNNKSPNNNNNNNKPPNNNTLKLKKLMPIYKLS